MGKIIAVANQKGGVGKTTTVINLGYALVNRGRRVLMVDCDPQGNCTSGLGVSKDTKPNIYDVIISRVPAKEAVVTTKYGGVLPSNKELSGAMFELVNIPRREFLLKDALKPLRYCYDYILLDCPPSLELLTLNALVAADSIIVPVQCEYFAMEGIGDLMTTITMTNAELNPTLRIDGIVLTMQDTRINLSEQVSSEIRGYFGDKVFKTAVPRNVRLSEAPSHGKPVIAYDRISKGSRAYMHLAAELIDREGALWWQKED